MDININKRSLIGFITLLLLVFITGYFIVSNNDMVEVFSAMNLLDRKYFILSIFLTAVVYFLLEALKFYRLLKPLEERVTFKRCIKYSTIGFFFAAITPLASGGQPMQLYYMKKDGLKLSNSSLIMLISTLAYKLVLVVITLVILVFANSMLKGALGGYLWMYYLCLLLNLALIFAWTMLVFSPNAAKKIIKRLEHFLVKIHILKYSEERLEEIDGFIKSFIEATDYFKENKLKVLETIMYSFLNRLLVTSITYIIYRGFGLSSEGYIKIITLQMIIMLTIDMLPLPGGQGASELLYSKIFSPILLGSLLPASLLVSRGVTFYIPLVICLFASGAFAMFRDKEFKYEE